jgi:predicted transcriptional regulator
MHDPKELLISTTSIVVAALSTAARSEDIPQLVASTYAALAATDQPSPDVEEPTNPEAFIPAVTVRKSLANDDFIVSMIDGKPYKTLRRHLNANGLTPEEYRRRYGLNSDYPMVAKNYAATRRQLALSIGLGRKPATPA